jgi:uncharacterized protein (DUF1810 family)
MQHENLAVDSKRAAVTSSVSPDQKIAKQSEGTSTLTREQHERMHRNREAALKKLHQTKLTEMFRTAPTSPSASESASASPSWHEPQAAGAATATAATNPRLPEPDPHNLRARFVRTQARHHENAVAEIKRGRKSSCWSWYCFPTPPFIVNGAEKGSSMNREYALRSDAAARAFLRFEGGVLRDHYVELIGAVATQLERGADARRLVGAVDEPKMRSSVRLFERISRGAAAEAGGRGGGGGAGGGGGGGGAGAGAEADGELHECCARVLRALGVEAGTTDGTGRGGHKR